MSSAHQVANPRAVLRRIVTYAPASVVPAAITLATSAVFTRIFDAGQFGIYGLALVVATTTRVFLTMWLIQGMARYLPAVADDRDRALTKAGVFLSIWVVLAVEVAFAAGLLALASWLFTPDEQGLLLPALVFLIVTSAFDVVGHVFPAEHRAGAAVTFKLADSVGTFGLRLFLASAMVGLGIEAMLWGAAISNAILLPFMWHRARLLAPTSLKAAAANHEVRRAARSLLAFGFPMSVWFFGTLLLDVGDRFVIAFFEGPAAMGVYDANYRLITGTVALMIVPVSMTLHPVLMAASASGRAEDVSTALKAVVESLVVLGALAVGLTAVLYPFIALMLGPEFRSGAYVMPIVLAGVFAFNIGTFTHKPFEIAHRTISMVVLVFAAAGVNMAMNLALVPSVGITGAAWATFVAFILYTLLTAIRGQRLLTWSFNWRSTLLRLLPIAIAVAALLALRAATEPWPLIWQFSAVTGASAVVAVWFLRRLVSTILATMPSPEPDLVEA